MKKPIQHSLLICILVMFSSFVLAQAPEAIKYQSIIRGTSGNTLINQQVSMQAIIWQGAPGLSNVYQENVTLVTNDFGLITRNIGEASLVSFASISWENGPFFLEVGIDPTGGTNYAAITGTSKILSVPYALSAKRAMYADSSNYAVLAQNSDSSQTSSFSHFAVSSGVSDSSLNESDPVFLNSLAAGIASTDTSYWNNKISIEIDGDILNEIQQISISNDTIFLSPNGGELKLPGIAVPTDPEINRGPLPQNASCPPNGHYTSPTVQISPGVYFYQLYSCTNQIGQVGAGFGVAPEFVTGSGDALGTWHNFNSGDCGVYYSGLIRVWTLSDVGIRYTSYSGSSFIVTQPNAEGARFMRIF